LKSFLVLYIVLLSLTFCNAQENKRSITATRIETPIKIDGILDEDAYRQSPKCNNFIQTEPTPGIIASLPTEVTILYDDRSIYVGARMYDDNPKAILKELSLRDQLPNADNFRIFFDPYSSGLHGFKFIVTSTGVQIDASVTNHMDDNNWNAVWRSKVGFDDKGWVVELEIPFSALRFPSRDVPSWGLQVGREIRRLREISYWSPIDPAINGWVQQSGKMEGIHSVKTPIRLALAPFIATYQELSVLPKKDSPNQYNYSGPSFVAGMDLKYGINDAFTLDMTLIPDFGQVISDRQVLNLSPFEVFFEENRQFFTEGTDLFNKGRLLYTRRVGGNPYFLNSARYQKYILPTISTNESINDLDYTTSVINATKISGRTSSGLGVGIFNAVEGEKFAFVDNLEVSTVRKITTNPLTNYNAIVLDQNLPNNSSISFMNTNVMRRGLAHDANVTGGFFNFRSKNQQYGLQGQVVNSNKFFGDSISSGYSYSILGGKVSGLWTYKLRHVLETHDYDPNDLGFLFSPNEVTYGLEGGYNQFSPKNKNYQFYSFTANVDYGSLQRPHVYNDFFSTLRGFFMLKSRLAYGFNLRFEPFDTRDYFEPRRDDFSRYLRWSANYMASAFISSDYRKPFAIDLDYSYRFFEDSDRANRTIGISPRFRFSDHFSLIGDINISLADLEPGYVASQNSASIFGMIPVKDDVMGERDRTTIENVLTARYIFNNVNGINVRIRHYWDRVDYQYFGHLDALGRMDYIIDNLVFVSLKERFDRNLSIFNIDLQYNWRFAPGSDLIVSYQNQIFSNAKDKNTTFIESFQDLLLANRSNEFSIRALYYLDYDRMTKSLKTKV
jgi:hypothetical protein